ncbi:MAG: cation:proton antiporter, partial [Caulobacter sp.]
MTPAELSVAFFLQMAVIIAACRGVGWFVKRYLGQPQVVGEMIAGVILGPSLLGLLFPDLQAMLFPKESKPILFVGAQLGVGLYMFLVGAGFNADHFKHNAKSATAVSLSGMVAPFLVAVALTPWLLGKGLFGAGIDIGQATLFMGAAISITAFPVLARIIQERGLSKTPLGAMSLSAGAIDDACAWSVLAIVLASMGGGAVVAMKAIIGGGVFAA